MIVRNLGVAGPVGLMAIGPPADAEYGIALGISAAGTLVLGFPPGFGLFLTGYIVNLI